MWIIFMNNFKEKDNSTRDTQPKCFAKHQSAFGKRGALIISRDHNILLSVCLACTVSTSYHAMNYIVTWECELQLYAKCCKSLIVNLAPYHYEKRLSEILLIYY
jgi:hypothetical protein